MDLISNNLKVIRKKQKITQQQLAKMLGITRASVGAYEEGRARPNYDLLKKISQLFNLSIDQLIKSDLSKLDDKERSATAQGTDISGNNLRVLAITVDSKEREFIQLVPQKAVAGYLSGYADQEYVEDLAKFRLPILQEGTYRAFEISGDSMLPILPGSIIIGEYISNWYDIKDGHTYIVVSSRDGVVYKRLFNKLETSGEIILQSDNPSYPPFSLPADEIIEIWQAKAYISTVFPNQDVSLNHLMKMMQNLQEEVVRLREKQ